MWNLECRVRIIELMYRFILASDSLILNISFIYTSGSLMGFSVVFNRGDSGGSP